jgi:hypothetical protein
MPRLPRSLDVDSPKLPELTLWNSETLSTRITDFERVRYLSNHISYHICRPSMQLPTAYEVWYCL